MILAIDTTQEFGSVALFSGDELIETPLYAESGFGQILFGALADILERSGRRLQDVDCFAAASGPGSFTGVRVGLACVKGLAEANGKRVVAVSNLEAIAAFGKGARRATVLDARRGEIYGAIYDAELKLIAPEVVAPFPQWLATLPPGEIEFVAQHFGPFRAAVAGTPFESAPVVEAPGALAAAIARIAHNRFRAGLAVAPEQVDANYVRRSDAELLWKQS